jgi:hypothetical protein
MLTERDAADGPQWFVIAYRPDGPSVLWEAATKKEAEEAMRAFESGGLLGVSRYRVERVAYRPCDRRDIQRKRAARRRA